MGKKFAKGALSTAIQALKGCTWISLKRYRKLSGTCKTLVWQEPRCSWVSSALPGVTFQQMKWGGYCDVTIGRGSSVFKVKNQSRLSWKIYAMDWHCWKWNCTARARDWKLQKLLWHSLLARSSKGWYWSCWNPWDWALNRRVTNKCQYQTSKTDSL